VKLYFGLPGLLLAFFLAVSPVFAADVVINEFLPAPSPGNSEWVEFYNTSSSGVDLSDYYFDDDLTFGDPEIGSNKIALSGILPAAGACFVELSSYLNNNGDTPTLFFRDGSVTDSYSYSSVTTDKSYARIPDGASWQANVDPTKASMSCVSLAPTPTQIPTPTPTSQPTSTPTPVATATPTPAPIKTPTPTLFKTPTPTSAKTPTPTVATASVSAQSSESAVLGIFNEPDASPASVPKTSRPMQPIIISLLFVGIGLALLSLVFIWQKRNALKPPDVL
jgi:hypothetical protein